MNTPKFLTTAIDAQNEAVYCGLPGRTNGPADAYRHLLWAGELARQYGYVAAKSIVMLHEIVPGNAAPLWGGQVQSASERAMDVHNNEIALRYGDSLRSNGGGSWRDVVNFSRSQINAAVSNPNPVDIIDPAL